MRNLLIAVVALWAALARVCANNPIRQVPYPQQEHIIYLNPAPLLVPYAMKQSDFLNSNLEQARRQVRSHPEFEYMIDDARDALAMNFSNDTKPYNQISRIAANCDKLNTAYQMMQQDTYADKMVKNVRCLLAAASDPKVIANDFSAGCSLLPATRIAKQRFCRRTRENYAERARVSV